MAKNPIAVEPETPLSEALEILLAHGFAGVPVVNEKKEVVGILTEYDVTLRGSALHLPTFIKLVKGFNIYKKDQGLIRDDIKKIIKMKVKDAMNPEPLLLREDQPIDQAIGAFIEHHRVNPIPIVDENSKLMGILSRHDLIKIFRSPSVELKENSERELDRNVNNFLKDFEKEYILVSKYRTRHWLLLSALFTIVGIIIAMAFMLRIKF